MSQTISKFSVHPKLAAGIDLVLNIGTLVIFPYLVDWRLFVAWFVARAVLWALFIRLVYYPPELSRWRHLWSLVFFNFGLIACLSIFVEWRVAWYLLMSVFVIFSATSFWLLPAHDGSLTFYQKPFRRWLFLMDTFGLAGFWCGLYALIAFQLVMISRGLWLYLIGSVVSAFMALWWWRVYGLSYSRRFWIAVGVIFVLTFELAWIVSRWPLGFMISGMTMIWFWYNLWLILRFNLLPEGIDWAKQKFFVISNIVLFIIFIFFAKWN